MPRRKRKKGEPPQLRHHKASGLGYIYVNGKSLYLGPFGSAECRRRYRDELQRWEEEYRVIRRAATLYMGKGATVAELVEAFLREVADKRYLIDGEYTSTWHACDRYLRRDLAEQFGDLLADEFRHPEFEEFRQQYLRRGYARNSIKQLIARVLVLFRWGHRRGAVSAETLTSLATSPEPDEGEERDPVEPVPADALEKLLAAFRGGYHFQNEQRTKRERWAAMIQIQDRVGMRPGELCRMTRKEVRQDATVKVGSKTIQVLGEDGLPYPGWIFQPSRHKTMKKGRYIAYLVGPQARALLEPWLPEDPEAYVWPGSFAGRCITYAAYKEAIKHACKRAGIPRFGPNRLRHGTATRYGLIAGLEKASQVLGHASLDTTSIYMQKSLQSVTALVEKLG